MIDEGNARIRELGAALLWLRNHYDLAAPDDAEKTHLVLKVIDGLLGDPGTPNSWLTLADIRAFREKHLKRIEQEVGQMFVEAKTRSFATPLVVEKDLTKKENK